MVLTVLAAGTRTVQAQDDLGDAAPVADNAGGGDGGGGGGGSQDSGAPTFYKIVFEGGFVNLLIWLMLFATSAAALALIIDATITVKRAKLLPQEVVDGVRQSLDQGDLNAALQTCEANPGPLSTILMVGFSNITEGYEVIQEAVASAAEMENEKLMQRVNYLNLAGQIAPMLGLLGTVQGMVVAFASLGTAVGGAKARLLAIAISTALWTTAVGLLISVPALLAYTLVKNYATRIVLEMEATVLDLIKVLRNAEVEE
jgi:biopolymer transport protein ExbB